MADRQALSGNTVRVQGTDDVEVPKEVADFFSGKGISMDFLKSYYGVGRSINIEPRQADLKAQMLGYGL